MQNYPAAAGSVIKKFAFADSRLEKAEGEIRPALRGFLFGDAGAIRIAAFSLTMAYQILARGFLIEEEYNTENVCLRSWKWKTEHVQSVKIKL